MKKLMTILLLAMLSVAAAAQTTYVFARNNNSQEEYYLDRKVQEKKLNQNQQHNAFAGVVTRFGYAYNYDAFTYGASIVYHWDGLLGVSVGFDGYYIPNRLIYRTIPNDTVSSNMFAMPLWDLRAGIMLGKYFMVGGLMGKSNVGDTDLLINMRENAWFVDNKDCNIMYGGFVTALLPVSKYFGFNIDFAVTNKTGFNVAAGFNVTFPVK